MSHDDRCACVVCAPPVAWKPKEPRCWHCGEVTALDAYDHAGVLGWTCQAQSTRPTTSDDTPERNRP